MFSEIDELKGFVKTEWKNIRKRVAKVEPVFAKLIDELNPGKDFPIYIGYFPYGTIEGDSKGQYFPKPDGGFFKLKDSGVSPEIIRDLGYGGGTAPMGMVLEKEFEYFFDLPDDNITMPWDIHKPGSFSPFSTILGPASDPSYTPNMMTSTAGLRSIFMLPNISCKAHHSKLQLDLKIQTPVPKCLYTQWNLFKEIANHPQFESDWRAAMIYFSKNWLDHLHGDKAWLPLKAYLHGLAWQATEYRRNHLFYEMIFSLIQKTRGLKPSPYLADTARHIVAIALGKVPGYAPACNDEGAPISLLQKVYLDSYGLRKYIPTIMQPSYFTLKKDIFPVYYSLQYPSTFMFSPKARKAATPMSEEREMAHIMKIFINELPKKKLHWHSGPIVNELNKNIIFDYFHNEIDRYSVVSHSAKIPDFDSRFSFLPNGLGNQEAIFASDARFLKGCISIRNNHVS